MALLLVFLFLILFYGSRRASNSRTFFGVKNDLFVHLGRISIIRISFLLFPMTVFTFVPLSAVGLIPVFFTLVSAKFANHYPLICNMKPGKSGQKII